MHSFILFAQALEPVFDMQDMLAANALAQAAVLAFGRTAEEVRADGTIRPWLSLDRHMMILRELHAHRPLLTAPRIECPVLLVPADTGDVAWTHDKEEAVAELLDALPDGRAHWFRPAHHDVHAQHPAEVAAVLMRLAEETDH